MNFLRRQLKGPLRARAIPYILLVMLTVAQDTFLPQSLRYWAYLFKMIVGAWCIWEMRSVVTEMRWAFSWEAVVAGVLVFLLWVGLDPWYPKIELIFKIGTPWNPFAEFGNGSTLAWFFVAVRTLGSAAIVPPIEEVFYRSLAYRYVVREDFTNLPLNHRHWLSFVAISLMFGFMHYQWLSGILCGLIYQGLVLRKNRLGDSMTAHAITNFLLGIWVVWKNQWQYW
jgi:uncharacterized protein